MELSRKRLKEHEQIDDQRLNFRPTEDKENNISAAVSEYGGNQSDETMSMLSYVSNSVAESEFGANKRLPNIEAHLKSSNLSNLQHFSSKESEIEKLRKQTETMRNYIINVLAKSCPSSSAVSSLPTFENVAVGDDVADYIGVKQVSAGEKRKPSELPGSVGLTSTASEDTSHNSSVLQQAAKDLKSASSELSSLPTTASEDTSNDSSALQQLQQPVLSGGRRKAAKGLKSASSELSSLPTASEDTSNDNSALQQQQQSVPSGGRRKTALGLKTMNYLVKSMLSDFQSDDDCAGNDCSVQQQLVCNGDKAKSAELPTSYAVKWNSASEFIVDSDSTSNDNCEHHHSLPAVGKPQATTVPGSRSCAVSVSINNAVPAFNADDNCESLSVDKYSSSEYDPDADSDINTSDSDVEPESDAEGDRNNMVVPVTDSTALLNPIKMGPVKGEVKAACTDGGMTVCNIQCASRHKQFFTDVFSAMDSSRLSASSSQIAISSRKRPHAEDDENLCELGDPQTIDNSPQQEAQDEALQTHTHTSAKPLKKRKPSRPCPYCNKMLPRLQRHIRTVHKNMEETQKACALPAKERNQYFKHLRRQAMFDFNKQQLLQTKPSLMRERNRNKNTRLVVCNTCNAMLVRQHFYRHKRLCRGDSALNPVALPLALLCSVKSNISQDFRDNILGKFLDDDIGQICRSDETIIAVGCRFYDKEKRKADKIDDVRRGVRMDMRRIARMYIAFKDILIANGCSAEQIGDSSSMLLRKNFTAVEESIAQCCTVPNVANEMESLKAGLKQGLYYLLQRMAKIMKARYLVDDNDAKAEEVTKFKKVLKLNRNIILGDAEYKINRKRQTTLRRPENLPKESDCRLLRDYTVHRVSTLTDEYTVWTRTEFVQLRDLIVSRLTLFNARRGGEPARLTLEEWSDAENNVWLKKKNLEKCDDVDRQLFKDFKLAYQGGKGNNHLVPILFPSDTVKAMRILCDATIRQNADINRSNRYLFASTQMSMDHVSGWHAVHRVSCEAGVTCTELLNPTKMRHLVSTLYAAIDVADKERQIFYKHMGHADSINCNVYQVPLAQKEITHVGRHLQQIDMCKLLLLFFNQFIL